MLSSLAKIRIPALLCIFLVLSFFFVCIIAPALAHSAEPELKPTVTSTTDKLKIHFIKTTRLCDAILIDLGESEMLIDGGFPNSGVADYIKDYVDGSLEAMVATHPHPDHIGGLVEVLKKFEVNEIWVNGDHLKLSPEVISSSPMSESLSKFVKLCEIFTSLANKEGAPVQVARRGQTIGMGILSFSVLHPDSLLPYSPSQKPPGPIFITMNNNSIVLRLRYGHVTFLFTGDASKKAEASMLGAGLGVQADILKVGHHGSKFASSPQFLKSVKPKVAVYMGHGIKKPKYGPLKPHPNTVAALKEVGAEVYGVDTHGTIVITTDGKKYTIETGK
jgi:competence protein ComEC